MSTRAKASGAVGSVIDGRFRDLQEQRDLGYPVGSFAPFLDTTLHL
jgi:regulator of RNase E activity RraA